MYGEARPDVTREPYRLTRDPDTGCTPVDDAAGAWLDDLLRCLKRADEYKHEDDEAAFVLLFNRVTFEWGGHRAEAAKDMVKLRELVNLRVLHAVEQTAYEAYEAGYVAACLAITGQPPVMVEAPAGGGEAA
jgi:hypothetical protein